MYTCNSVVCLIVGLFSWLFAGIFIQLLPQAERRRQAMFTRIDVLFERDLLPSAANGGLVNAAELVNPAKVAARRFHIEKHKTLNDLAEVCILAVFIEILF